MGPRLGRRRRRRQDDDGFTLLELMVVVLIIAILLAIAVPTFLGAREAAWDRAAQSNVRNAHTSLMVFYADEQSFTEDPAVLQGLDPALRYEAASLAALLPGNTVFVDVITTLRPSDTVLVAGRSGSGRCFWLRTVGDENEPRFTSNDCSATPPSGAFTDRW